MDRYAVMLLNAARNGCDAKVNQIIRRYGLHSRGMDDGYNALCIALAHGHLGAAEILLKHGAKVNSEHGKGKNTPLHLASLIEYNHRIFKLLIEGSADLNARNAYLETPLHWAVKTKLKNKVFFVRALLKSGANVDGEDIKGKTALQLAVELAQLDVLKEILKHSPDISAESNRRSVNIVNCESSTFKAIVEALNIKLRPAADANHPELLHAAVEKRYYQIAEDVHKYGANVQTTHKNMRIENSEIIKQYRATDREIINKIIQSAIFRAIQQKNIGNTKLLIKYGATVTGQLLRMSVRNECIEIVELLLEYGVDVNDRDEQGRTALHAATKKGFVSLVEVLLQHNAKITAESNQGVTPFHIAASLPNDSIITMFLQKGVDINVKTSKGENALHFAAESGCPEIIQKLLTVGVNYNYVDNFGITPFIRTALSNNKKGAEVFIEMGATGAVNGFFTALSKAVTTRNLNAVKLLLNCGADPNATDEDGCTALVKAAGNGFVSGCEELLKFGADINGSGSYYNTPLHCAIERGYVEVVAALLKYNPDINITDQNNYTCIDYVLSFINNSVQNEETPLLIGRLLTRYIVKIHSYVTWSTWFQLKNSAPLGVYMTDCDDEMNKMLRKIKNSNISFFDVLVNDAKVVANYLGNENVLRRFQTESYKKRFPIYAAELEEQYKKAMKIKLLFDKAAGNLQTLLPTLPDNCIYIIMNFLKKKEMRILKRLF